MVFSVPSVMAGVVRSCSLHGGDLLLLLGLLGDAKLLLHLHAELVGGTAELAHQLPELTREFGQLLRAEENQSKDEDEGAIAEARHNSSYDTVSFRQRQSSIATFIML